MSEKKEMNTPTPKFRVWDYKNYNNDEISQYEWNNSIIGVILDLCDNDRKKTKLEIPEKFKNMFLNLNLSQSGYKITYTNSDNDFIIVNKMNFVKIENYEHEELLDENKSKISDLVDQFYSSNDWDIVKYSFFKNLPHYNLDTKRVSLWNFNVNQDTILDDDLAYRLLILSSLYFNNKNKLNTLNHLNKNTTIRRDLMRSNNVIKDLLKQNTKIKKGYNIKSDQHIINILYSNILNNKNNKIILDYQLTDEKLLLLILQKYAKNHSIKLSDLNLTINKKGDLNLTINNKGVIFKDSNRAKFASVTFENDVEFIGNNHIIVNDDLKIILSIDPPKEYLLASTILNSLKDNTADTISLIKESLKFSDKEKMKIVGPPIVNVTNLPLFKNEFIEYITYQDNKYAFDDYHNEFYIVNDEYLYFNSNFIDWDKINLNELK